VLGVNEGCLHVLYTLKLLLKIFDKEDVMKAKFLLIEACSNQELLKLKECFLVVNSKWNTLTADVIFRLELLN